MPAASSSAGEVADPRLDARPEPLSPGQRVDRYIVEGKLGEGGMAVVWRVRHETLETRHALKILTLEGRNIRKRLVREGQAQARMDHDNVVPVTDVLDVDGQPGLLMPYVAGPSLEAWLARYRPSLDEALTLFRGIAAGVGHAHARGLVHRDLKPANVLLAVSNGRLVPQVTDFGLAKDLERSGHTSIGAKLGTPEYMAPEQVLDASGVDRRADLWSLGCILYRLVCGVSPFDGDEVQDVLRAVQLGDRVDSRRIRPELPERVHEVIDRLIDIDPTRRLADCDVAIGYLDRRLDRLPPPTVLLEAATAPTTLLPRWLPADGEAGAVAKAIARETLKALPKLDRGDERPEPRPRKPKPRNQDKKRRAPAPVAAVPTARVASAERRAAQQAPARSRSRAVVGVSLVAGSALGLLLLALGGTAVVVAVRAGVLDLATPGGSVAPVVAEPPPVEPAPEVAPAPAEPASPRPSRRTPAPAEPAPAPPSRGNGRVAFEGVDDLWLVDAAGTEHHDLTAVPPGAYRVFARFPRGPSGAGEIDVAPGRTVHLTCSADFARCKVR
ncbi:MAG: serine/threonine-protein kinase [Myxococcota bacterium]